MFVLSSFSEVSNFVACLVINFSAEMMIIEVSLPLKFSRNDKFVCVEYVFVSGIGVCVCGHVLFCIYDLQIFV